MWHREHRDAQRSDRMQIDVIEFHLCCLLRDPAISVAHASDDMHVIKLDKNLTPHDLLPKLERFWARSAECIEAIEVSCPPGSASPVFTVERPLHGPRLDRVDAGLSIRLDAAAVRCHGRRAVSRAGPRADAVA